jgi:Tfp pilus assembly protein PilN
MIRINLIPPEYIEKMNRRVVIAKAVLGGILVLTVMSLVSVWQVSREAAISSSLKKRTAELQSLQGDVDKVKAIEGQIAEVQRYLNAINRVAKGRFIYTRFLQDTAAALPATIWLSSINTTLSGDTLAVSFSVNSRSANDLAYWINLLETTPDYASVDLAGGIAVTEDEAGKIFATQIKLSCVYR